MASGPLDGIRILEFTQIIAGPFGCMMLADQGAEVIKVEPPSGEPWRLFAQFMPGESKTFQELNRGKRSLVLDLSDAKAQEVIHKLVPSVDVVVINYRPDVGAKLRIDYPMLSALRPDLIYVDNTAFGRKGPWAQRPGYDIVVQAASGLMVGEGKFAEDGRPDWITSTAIADYATGLAIAWAVTSALYHRERTGEGQMIETTLLATALAFQAAVMEHPLADAGMRAPARERRRQLQKEGASYQEMVAARNQMRAIGGNIYYRTYLTKDGAIAIGALSPTLWAKVRAALETDFLGSADPEFAPLDSAWQAKARAKVAEVEAYVKTKTSEEWMAIFDREGVPASTVKFPEDMFEEPQVLANDMMVELDHDLSGPQTMVAPILRMSKTPLAAQGAAPPLGRDTEHYLREAGLSAAEIADLRSRAVIQ